MTIIRLKKLDDDRLDPYVRLTENQLRNRLEPEQGLLIAESAIAIRVALGEGIVPRSLLLQERQLTTCHDLVERMPEDVPVFVLPEEQLSKLAGYRVTRGPLCAMRRPRLPGPAEVVQGARRVAVLEGLVDVSNVGAVFRSAAALDVDAVLVGPTCADPFVRRAVRVSMGTVFQVPWARVGGPWPQGIFDLLHGEGFACAALALKHGAIPLDDPALREIDKLALFFGTEGTGLTRKVIDGCDYRVIIPMSHGVDSLNVAASSAVAFWELCHKPRR